MWSGHENKSGHIFNQSRAERVVGSPSLLGGYTINERSTFQPALPLKGNPSTDAVWTISLKLDVQETLQVLTG